MKVKVQKYRQMSFEDISEETKEEQFKKSYKVARAFQKLTSACASEISEVDKLLTENKKLKELLKMAVEDLNTAGTNIGCDVCSNAKDCDTLHILMIALSVGSTPMKSRRC